MKKFVRIVLLTLAMIASVGAVQILIPRPAAADVGQSIASTATSQLGQHCQPYGGCYTEWCSIFATWVWAQNAIQYTDDLSPGAISFYWYGQSHGTLHSAPQVGDAVVFKYDNTWNGTWADHVAIVTAVNGFAITTVGGNEGDLEDNYATTVQADHYGDWRNVSSMKAFIGPVPQPGSSLPAGSGGSFAVNMGDGWPQVMLNEAGQLHQIVVQNGNWIDFDTTVRLPAGSPIAVVNMGGGWPQVMSNENGQLHQTVVQNGNWVNYDTTVRLPAGSPISAVNMGEGWPQVMSNENGQLHQTVVQNGNWVNYDTTVRLPAGSPISAVNMGEGWPQVMSNENGQLHQTVVQNGNWVNYDTTVRLPAGSPISAVNMGEGWPQVMSNENGQLHQTVVQNGNWVNYDTTVRLPAGSPISAVNMGEGWPQVMSNENGQLHQTVVQNGNWVNFDTTIRVP